MNERKIFEVMRIANAGPAVGLRQEFFTIKEHLLKTFVPNPTPAWQRIIKPCWGTNGLPCQGQQWCRCGGTGRFEDRYVIHMAYEWYGHKFLVPNRRLPASEVDEATLAGPQVPWPLPYKSIPAKLEATVAIFEAFTDENSSHGDRYIVSRMRVAMGQIPRRLLIEFPVEIPF